MDYEQILNNIACTNNFLMNYENMYSFYTLTTNKKKAISFLRERNFPTTKQIDLNNKKLNPKNTIIVKPNDKCCGDGIIVDKLENIRKMNIPEDYIKETYLVGTNYRIILYRGQIVSIIERHFPQVIGDGKHTIQDLIDIENTSRTIKNKIVHQLKPYMLKRVPIKGKIVRVAKICNYCKGGRIVDYPINKVHPDNIRMFLDVGKATQFNIFAIDYITSDITKSYKSKNVKSGINELENNGHAVHYSINDKFSKLSSVLLIRFLILLTFMTIFILTLLKHL
jgi:cyanophycin synthetase